MSARDGLFNHLTGRSLCPPPRPAEEATGLLDSHHDDVRAETLADIADLFDYRSRALAPDAALTAAEVASLIRQHAAGKDTGDGTQPPAGESTQPAPDFFQPGHTYSDANFPEYGWKFRCDSITQHPGDGERTALGWRLFKGEWDPYAYGEGDWDVHQFVGIADEGEASRG